LESNVELGNQAIDAIAQRDEAIAVLRKERDALKVEYDSRAAWIAEMNAILGYDNSDGFHSEPDPFQIAATLRRQRDEAIAVLRECDDLMDAYCLYCLVPKSFNTHKPDCRLAKLLKEAVTA